MYEANKLDILKMMQENCTIFGKEICEIIWSLMQENNKDLKGETLLDCVIHLQEEQESLHEFKEELKDAAVAVKLAMNFFELVKVD